MINTFRKTETFVDTKPLNSQRKRTIVVSSEKDLDGCNQHEVVRFNKYCSMLHKIEKNFAILRICSSFRTVSTNALLVLAKIKPIIVKKPKSAMWI